MKVRLVLWLVLLNASWALGCKGPNPLFGLGVAAVGDRTTRPRDGGPADRPRAIDLDLHAEVGIDLSAEVPAGLLSDASSDGGVDAEDAPPVSDAVAATDAPGEGMPAAAAGPVAHWRFDENMGQQAADDTGNGNGGSLKRGATWTANGFPRAQFANPSALRLDGVGYVEMMVPTLPALAAAKSITGWFWIDGSIVLGRRNLIALVNRAASASLQLGFDVLGRLTVWQGSEGALLVKHDAFILPGWHHVAYVYDGAEHRLYFDGALTDRSSLAALSAPVTSAWLGTFDGTAEMFAGRLDDVRIYAHPLSIAAVRALAGGAAGF